MKQIAIILISFSLCFGAGKMPKKMEQLKQDLQEKYQVFSMDDLYKLKTPSQSSQSSNRSASRDMEDLVGDWIMEDESLELFVTVGSDQSIPDPFSTMGFVEAVGGVTATTSDFETDLNYLMIGLFGDDGPDCNMNCEGEYDDYMSYGYDVSDEYCECCHEDYPIDEICEDDGGDNLSLEFEGIADMYYARYGAAYATDGNMVYAICGADWDSEVDSTVYHTHGERYNPGDDSWEMFGENLLPRRYTNAEYVNGSIYVFNGYGGATDDEPIFFEKEDYADVSDPANWDQITESVAITRADNQGLFNPYSESSYNELGEYGPAGTLWAPMSTEEATMLDTNVYTSWHAAMNNNPQSFIDDTVSLWCLEEDKYYDIVMASWTNGNNGGGFSYWRHPADGHDEEDDGPDLLIMNMDLMEFFMVSFGMDLDSLDIENPTVIGFGSSSDDENMVMGLMFDETGVIELMADSEEAAAATSIDETSITFTNLSLYDSTGTAVLTVTGTIGPGWIDFEAGVETPIDLFNEDGEGDDDMEFYVSFSEDSTGMDIEVAYDDYYGEEYSDTSYFNWSATTDSLFLYYESDYYYYEDEADTMALGYMIIEDTLFASASFNPCEDDGYESYEECFSDMDLPGFDELVDVESFRVSQETVFTSTVLTSIEPTNGELPEEFKLYAAYPNPFNPVTTIRFDVGSTSHESTLRIYDVSGRNVATLINGQLQPGSYEVQWDARGFASGIYFSELISGTKRHTQKMVLLK